MHKQLETYLADVAERLSLLPAEERAEELREMQVHLEQIVAQHQEQGLSENDAVTLTLTRFGEPEAVGQDLLTAWQRGEAIKNKRSLWSAVAGAVTWVASLMFITNFLNNLVARNLIESFWTISNAHHFELIDLIGFALGLNIALRVAVCAFCGFLLPRPAVPAMIVGMSGLVFLDVVHVSHVVYALLDAASQSDAFRAYATAQVIDVDKFVTMNLMSLLIVSFGAMVLVSWVGSRWRMRRELALAR